MASTSLQFVHAVRLARAFHVSDFLSSLHAILPPPFARALLSSNHHRSERIMVWCTSSVLLLRQELSPRK